MSKTSWSLALFALAFVLLHLAFLHADPFVFSDVSRGAFTDEGLYSYQLRNFFLGGPLNLHESDGFLKTPFYNFLAAPFIALNQLWILRLITAALLGVTCSVWMIRVLKHQFVPIALFFLLCTQSTFFSHTHFALAEGFVFSFALLSIYSFVILRNPYFAIFFLGIAVGCKIQYLHFLGLLPIYLFSLRNQPLDLKKIAVSFIPMAILLVFWIYFQKDYQYILGTAQQGKFQDLMHIGFRIKVNLSHLLKDGANRILILLLLTTGALLGLNYKNLTSVQKRMLGMLWFLLLLESHKLFYVYLPLRYLFTWFGVIILIISYQSFVLLAYKKLKMPYSLIMLSLIIIGFIFQYTRLINSRTFEMENVRQQVAILVPDNFEVVSPWAPSLTFGTQIKSHTAWSEFYENQELWNVNNELKSNVFIIAEDDEDGTHGLFTKHLGHLSKLAVLDSFKIKDWNLVLYR